jgi:hypothetical protein
MKRDAFASIAAAAFRGGKISSRRCVNVGRRLRLPAVPNDENNVWVE